MRWECSRVEQTAIDIHSAFAFRDTRKYCGPARTENHLPEIGKVGCEIVEGNLLVKNLQNKILDSPSSLMFFVDCQSNRHAMENS